MSDKNCKLDIPRVLHHEIILELSSADAALVLGPSISKHKVGATCNYLPFSSLQLMGIQLLWRGTIGRPWVDANIFPWKSDSWAIGLSFHDVHCRTHQYHHKSYLWYAISLQFHIASSRVKRSWALDILKYRSWIMEHRKILAKISWMLFLILALSKSEDMVSLFWQVIISLGYANGVRSTNNLQKWTLTSTSCVRISWTQTPGIEL